jgi:hypothetical protein
MDSRQDVINRAVASVVNHGQQLVAALAKVAADVALQDGGEPLLSQDEQTEVVEALKAGTLPYLGCDGAVCGCRRCGDA